MFCRRLAPTLLLVLATALFCQSLGSAAEESNDEFFERRIRPLLVQHCFSCHGKGQKKGGLSLETRAGLLAGGESGTAVVLDKPEASLLVKALKYDELQMPPNGKLADAEVKLFADWIARGAPWPESKSAGGGIRSPGEITASDRQFWSFQPVHAQPLPSVRQTEWPRDSLDAFLLARLEAEDLQPAAPAERLALLRRATFDLTGLPPTVEEIDSYATDDSPDAYERLLDRLLASPRFGERWARHWLDVARYGEDQAHTFQARMYPSGYRYRDWVIQAFNSDLPYDRFVVEQIAADLLPDGDKRPRLPALGFFALGPVYYADAGCAQRAVADELDDRVDTLTRGLLGLTVSCARCHDHKFDPITTRDYYALAGVFASSKYVEAPLAPPEVVANYEQAQQRVKDQEKAITSLQNDLAKLARQSFAPAAAKYVVAGWKLQNRRKTEASLSASGLAKEEQLTESIVDAWSKYLSPDNLGKKAYLEPLKAALANLDSAKDMSTDETAVAALKGAAETLQAQLLAAIAAREKIEADYATAVAAAPAEEKSKVAKAALNKSDEEVLKDLVDDTKSPLSVPNDKVEKYAPAEETAKLASARKELERLKAAVGPKYPFAHSLTDAEPKNLQIHLRGDHKTLGDEAPRRFLEVLSASTPAPFSQGSGRLELAEQIASEQNPLTARVFVNRVWEYTFGRGIVGTPSNFGMLGERPTHPELLDDLTSRFTAHGWSLKWLQRQLLSSSAYRQSTGGNAEQFERDPDNRLLWRMNRRRLDIEAWRDATLSASGALELTIGGPSLDLNSDKNRRRTLYAVISRHNLNSTLRLFDFPDPNLTSERRVSTTVPMQQLFVMNSEFTIREAKTLAARLEREGGPEVAERIAFAYRLLFSRLPTSRELQLGTEFVNAAAQAPPGKLSAWERYAQALLAANEFAFLD